MTFGIERDDVIVLGDDKPVNLKHSRIAIPKGPVGTHNRRNCARHLLYIQSKLKGQFARLESLQPHGWINNNLKERFRVDLGDLLDPHPTMTRRNYADTFGLPIQHIAQIELTLIAVGDFDINSLDRLSVRTGLCRNQTLSQKVTRRLLDLIVRLAQPNPTQPYCGHRHEFTPSWPNANRRVLLRRKPLGLR
jgi:hypothetical protein